MHVGSAPDAIAVNDPAVTARSVVKVEVHQNIDTPFPVHSQASFPYPSQQDISYFLAHPAHLAIHNNLAVFVPLLLAEGTAVFRFPRVSLLEYTNY